MQAGMATPILQFIDKDIEPQASEVGSSQPKKNSESG